MFYIDTESDVPNIDYLKFKMETLMNQGIGTRDDIGDLYASMMVEKENAASNLRRFGISNPNSTNDILSYLDSIMDANIENACYIEKTDKWTTNKESLIQLAHQGYDIAIKLMVYRKIKSFSQSIKSIMDARASDDNRIRPTVSFGKTNRVNYSEPAMMNIPKAILWNTLAPLEKGNVLIGVDIKNQEPWILINMLDIEELKDMLNKNDKAGLYNRVYARVYGGEPTEIQRSELKTAWNAMTYGGTKFVVNKTCKNIDGAKLYKYFNSIKELKDYKGKSFALATNRVKELKTLFGTTVCADRTDRNGLQRQLMDLPIQGTGSDILALLVEHFELEVEERGLQDSIFLYFTRHDELIFEVDRAFFDLNGVEAVTDILRDILEHQVDEWEPFRVEIKVLEPNLSLMLEYEDEDM